MPFIASSSKIAEITEHRCNCSTARLCRSVADSMDAQLSFATLDYRAEAHEARRVSSPDGGGSAVVWKQ